MNDSPQTRQRGGGKKCKHIGQGFRTAAAADADLSTAMCSYLDEWGDETTVSWVRAHAEDGGAQTNDHEKQNKKAGDDAEKVYTHPDSSLYKVGCCSQFDTIWGGAIDGKVVAHKTGATVLRHVQKKQYLRYWKTRRLQGRCLGV